MSCMCSKQAVIATDSPTEVLKDEHRVIEKVLEAMERRINTTPFDRPFFAKAIDFLRNFADGCHHAKEEDELFPALESAGVPREQGPIGCMLHEHEQGRSLIGMIAANLDSAEKGDATATQTVWKAAAMYVGLLRQHIQKEDNILFVMADQVLDPQQKQQVREGFHRSGHGSNCVTQHQHYIELAEQLSQWPEAVVCVRA